MGRTIMALACALLLSVASCGGGGGGDDEVESQPCDLCDYDAVVATIEACVTDCCDAPPSMCGDRLVRCVDRCDSCGEGLGCRRARYHPEEDVSKCSMLNVFTRCDGIEY